MTPVLAVTRNGLSPRVRGNHAKRRYHKMDIGSIPACAGEPRTALRPPGAPKVYPRVCGGTPGPVSDVQRCEGLSPRVRGNLHAGHTEAGRFRSIPACAGEPTSAHP